ncbi:hypothetical protein [Sphingobacterium faecium]|uniref:hypothetical protein n=1 Tax=Sphingobacterium faecium TaxID=34087 RepID=UPI00320A3A30
MRNRKFIWITCIASAVCCANVNAQVANVFPATGKVGIGTLAPTELLQINGNVKSFKNIITNEAGRSVEISPTEIISGLGTIDPKTRTLHYEIASNWDASQIRLRTGSTYLQNTIRIQTDYNGVSLDGKGGVYFGLNNTDTHVMLSNGNVGIGTLEPTEKLSVKGNIRAQQVKVEMANWPDYVFEETYQLPSLKETEAFIKANKHLPGVPKAKEIEEDGLSLGEMNKILMQKVEELTLHLINKDKEISQLKETNTDQYTEFSKRLSDIEKALKK